MAKRHPVSGLILVALILLLAACGREAAPQKTETPAPVTLEQVRERTAKALDGKADSKERERAREEAMQALLAFLRTTKNFSVSQAEWDQLGTSTIRHLTSGKVQVVGLTIPASGVVPPGERVAVQFQPSGQELESSELKVLPGGQLQAAHYSEINNQPALTLIFDLAKGGGYVAHYQRDSLTGEFKPSATAFRSLPSRMGDLVLDNQDGFLVVTTALSGLWNPSFDEKEPLLVRLNNDVALEWTDRFVVDSGDSTNIFAEFQTALDPKADAKVRQEAWTKASTQLPKYLEKAESWSASLEASLPAGARAQSDQLAHLQVRVISIPAPALSTEPSLTIVQHRSGNGLPSAQVLSLPGVMENVRVIERNGLTGLMILSGNGARKTVTLVRLSGDNTWVPAPDWFGFIAPQPGVRMTTESHHLLIETDSPADVQLGQGPAVNVCPQAHQCFSLTWTGEKLNATSSVVGRLREIAPGKPATYEQVLLVTQAVKGFVSSPEARSLSLAELNGALGVSEGTGVTLIGIAHGGRVIGMPPNEAHASPLLVQTGAVVHVESVAPGSIDRWLEARVVTAGGSDWLLVLGQGENTAAVLLYRWSGSAWEPVNALAQPFERILMEQVRVSYTPGQMNPVRGIYLSGSRPVGVALTPDRQGVQFCELQACITYQFRNGWSLQ